MNKHYNHINIGHWNIHGLTEKVSNSVINKLLDSDFVKVFKKLDLFCLSGTHIGPDFNVMLQDYHVYKNCKRVSANNRFFDGLCIFTSKLIKDGVKIVKNSHQDIIWLKLRKEFFKLDRHLFLCFSYISSSNSIYFKNNDSDSDFLFDRIRQGCADFMSKGDILLMRDFNAYIPNNAFDYIEDDELDYHIPLPDDIYQPDIPLTRNTMEFRKVNHNGKLLLEMCKSVSARILNGRLIDDTSGRFTRFPTYQNVDVTDKLLSVIDYSVSNVNLFQK